MKIIENKIYISIYINNNKYIIKDFYIGVIMALILSIFFGNSSTLVDFILLFMFFMVLNSFLILITKITKLSNEEMNIYGDTISLRFTSFGKKWSEYTISNDASINIEYHETLFSNINLSPSIYRPNRSRRLKLITNKRIYRFGYNLSREEFDIIKKLILKQREIYQQNLEK